MHGYMECKDRKKGDSLFRVGKGLVAPLPEKPECWVNSYYLKYFSWLGWSRMKISLPTQNRTERSH